MAGSTFDIASVKENSVVTVTPTDVEKEVRRLFSSKGLVITVHGDDDLTGSSRADAFAELLDSLAMYDGRIRDTGEITVEPPDKESLAIGLSILGHDHLQKKLFQQILTTVGKRLIEPLGSLLSSEKGGSLYERMVSIRTQIHGQVQALQLSAESQEILLGDLEKVLTNDYLEMLAEHEEKVQAPRAAEMAQEVLHLIGTTFKQAFQQWPEHAQTIATTISRLVGPKVELRENPLVIRDRIVEGIEDFLWNETSTEVSGALGSLFSQKRYQGLIPKPYPTLDKKSYREFALACWTLIEQNG